MQKCFWVIHTLLMKTGLLHDFLGIFPREVKDIFLHGGEHMR